MHSAPIFVIGSSNTDMVVKTPTLPLPGQTVLGGAFLMNAGGKGANQAVAAARLGGAVWLCAKVGNDIFGQQALRQFEQEAIRTDFVLTDAEQPSGVALINVDEKGENSITVASGANANLKPADVAPLLDTIPPGSIVLLQLEIPLETVGYVVARCFEKAIRVILNPAPAQPLPTTLMPQLYGITPNETEAHLLTGIRVSDAATAQQAAQYLQQQGIPNVIITLGQQGAYVQTADFSGLIPTKAVKAVDTTAAGDCFNGALAVALVEASPLPKAVAFACRAAALCVTQMGAQSSMPYRSAVDSFL